MPTLEKTTKYDSEHRLVDPEAELRRDEKTGAAERLSLPMEHTFLYEKRDGELFSEFGLSLDEVVHGGLEDIKRMVAFYPDWAGEVSRRECDVEELAAISSLRPGEKQITFLPIPDDVRAGRTTIGGYDRARMRMLVRLAEAKPNNQVAITSFSLDRSYYPGLQAAARAVGHEIPDNLSSNEVMRDRVHIGDDDTRTSGELVDLLRTAYDAQLRRDLGGEWYAGCPPINPANALAFVESQTDLFAEHIKTIKYITLEFFGVERDVALEEARYNYAARLDGLLHGQHYASAESAGAEARSLGKTFEGDCPPSLSIVAQADKLGFAREVWKVGEKKLCVNCPLCKALVTAIKTRDGIRCNGCDKELVTANGRSRIIDHKKNQQEVAKTALSKTVKAPLAKSKKPPYTIKTRITFGGTTKQLFNSRGDLLAEGHEAETMQKRHDESF